MYTKKEMIAIGDILKSVDKFEKNIKTGVMPDPKVPDRKYMYVRIRFTHIKNQGVRYEKYLGKVNEYSPEHLTKVVDELRKNHHDFINQQLSKYNCKLEDFK